ESADRFLRTQRGRGRTREAADRRSPVRAAVALAERAASRPRAERVPEGALLRGVRALAPGPDRGRRRGDEGALRLRMRRLPAAARDGPDRLPLPRRRVAAQGDRTRRARSAPVPGREDRALIGLEVDSEPMKRKRLSGSLSPSPVTESVERRGDCA